MYVDESREGLAVFVGVVRVDDNLAAEGGDTWVRRRQWDYRMTSPLVGYFQGRCG